LRIKNLKTVAKRVKALKFKLPIAAPNTRLVKNNSGILNITERIVTKVEMINPKFV